MTFLNLYPKTNIGIEINKHLNPHSVVRCFALYPGGFIPLKVIKTAYSAFLKVIFSRKVLKLMLDELLNLNILMVSIIES